jgi:hypothetical protein
MLAVVVVNSTSWPAWGALDGLAGGVNARGVNYTGNSGKLLEREEAGM